MLRFQVAHVREQGIDLIIIPLDTAFGFKSRPEQQEIVAELQMRAATAGLAGTVVPVWRNCGRMSFLAPPNWHPFFRSLSLAAVARNINKELYWS